MPSTPHRSRAIHLLGLIALVFLAVVLSAPGGPLAAHSQSDDTLIPPTNPSTSEPEPTTTEPEPTTTEPEPTTTEPEPTTTTTQRATTTVLRSPTSGGPAPTVGAPVAPPSAPPTTAAPKSGGDGLSLGTLVFLMVSGMLLAAGGLAWFTWRVWDRTRPELPPGAVAAPPWHQRVADYLRI